MSEISTQIIEEAIYKLCFDANICLDKSIYEKILAAYKKNHSDILKNILKNAKNAYDLNLPLCQDTGQVIVFLEIGQNVKLTGEFILDSVNKAVEKCYIDNFFRKSTVRNSVFDRQNTNNNTPAIIYTKYINGDEIKITVLIKGAGSENKSKLEMLLPTSSEEEIISRCSEMVLQAGINACPPMFIGIGIGATADKACVMSKIALCTNEFTKEEIELADRIKETVNSKAPSEYKNFYVLDVKVLTAPTHIACMPAAVTINCHSERISSCIINKEGIIYNHKVPNFIDIEEEQNTLKEVFANDIEKLKSLKHGEKILLTGEIYVARDMAHKRLFDLIKENKKLPINLKGSIIFYAGPCPEKPSRIIGSIGPTTASRMDKYAGEFYERGMIASIGKGTRSDEIKKIIHKNKAKYFTLQGGIAALLSEKVKQKEVIAFNDLGTEALMKIYVEKLPICVDID